MSALPALTLVAFLFAAPADGKAHLSDFRLSVRGGRVEVSFALVNPADDEMVERIQTGLPSGYDFQFRLVRGHRRWWDLRWWDQSLDSTTLQVFATYDAVTREYLVNYRLNGKLIQSQVVRELDELRQAMTRFEGIHIFTVEPRAERRRLQVRARAKLGDRNLLGFIPSTRTTDWVESSRFTSPAG